MLVVYIINICCNLEPSHSKENSVGNLVSKSLVVIMQTLHVENLHTDRWWMTNEASSDKVNIKDFAL